MSKKFKVQFIVMVGIPEKRIFFWIAITKKKQNNSSYVRPCLSSIKKVLMTKKGTTPGLYWQWKPRNFKINPPLKASTPSISKVLILKDLRMFPNLAFDSVMRRYTTIRSVYRLRTCNILKWRHKISNVHPARLRSHPPPPPLHLVSI